jgi:hypothetical protein
MQQGMHNAHRLLYRSPVGRRVVSFKFTQAPGERAVNFSTSQCMLNFTSGLTAAQRSLMPVGWHTVNGLCMIWLVRGSVTVQLLVHDQCMQVTCSQTRLFLSVLHVNLHRSLPPLLLLILQSLTTQVASKLR